MLLDVSDSAGRSFFEDLGIRGGVEIAEAAVVSQDVELEVAEISSEPVVVCRGILNQVLTRGLFLIKAAVADKKDDVKQISRTGGERKVDEER